MIINPTKKALPIFNQLVKVTDPTITKNFAQANPFFSWHANYYTLQRKKVVILVNDLTYATIVLYDINAKSKKQLAQYIVAGVRAAFTLVGISDTAIDKYLEMAGKVELNAGFDRHVTGAMSNLILIAELHGLHEPQQVIQTKLMAYLMQIPFQHKKYAFVKDAAVAAFATNLTIVDSTNFAAENSYQLHKTWTNYHRWDKYENDQALLTGNGDRYEKIMAAVQSNNHLLLTEFKNYLANDKGFSRKVINKHAANSDLFINNFLLYYTIKTPLKAGEEVAEYLGEWFPRKIAYSTSDIQTNATSLRKFFDFLVLSGELTQAAGAAAKAAIKIGVNTGFEHIRLIENLGDFY
ncbi:DUF6933 domain-containing protein [Loigolactobacillus jiayinensis]|uniref:DUF6933 domain-containing protein n=1 Tax=Loigolactobacillus jiayinensis TaxID=2486016 RepID=A0ABW1RGN9_9LACO|nr:hypothetical protein [Loigolactobacillus jiayinensis]